MSVTVKLDDIDITEDLRSQHPQRFPEAISAGIYPDNSHSKWWDLWACVQAHQELREAYQKNAIHELVIEDTAGGTYDAKIILRTKYTARNR